MTMMIINKLLEIANDYLIPCMCIVFFAGIAAKACLYFLKKSQLHFVKHVEKKIYLFLIDKEKKSDVIEKHKQDYGSLTTEVMNIAYVELFEMKIQRMRRKLDYVTSFTDRLFLLVEGAKRLNKDVEQQVKYYAQDGEQPDFDHITHYASKANPSYNKLFGIFSNHSLDACINLLPGLFVIGGIFGTFVGIMQALPELTHMDLTSPEMTKKTMDMFLNNIAYSMNTSLVGIVLCVCMNILNTLMDADEVEEEFNEKLKGCLVMTWHESQIARKQAIPAVSLAATTPIAVVATHQVVEAVHADEPPPLKMIG